MRINVWFVAPNIGHVRREVELPYDSDKEISEEVMPIEESDRIIIKALREQQNIEGEITNIST